MPPVVGPFCPSKASLPSVVDEPPPPVVDEPPLPVVDEPPPPVVDEPPPPAVDEPPLDGVVGPEEVPPLLFPEPGPRSLALTLTSSLRYAIHHPLVRIV